MFQHHGPSRSDRQNRVLAGYLAFIGGFVNSAGFVLIGTFTSHVTGNVGRLANDLAAREADAAAAAFTMIAAFFLGSFVASMIVESNLSGRHAHAYGTALMLEGGLLLLFTVVTSSAGIVHARLNDMQAAILCAAMGMQNSLVTRLSGAVVRTTHLTGVITDVGIEAARWFRWWRGQLSARVHVKLSVGASIAEKPLVPKIALLSMIAAAFMVGAIAGAASATILRHAAMLVPSAAVIACGAYAFWSGAKAAHDSRK